MWQEFSTGLTTSISEVMKIIDDALCYGFEFKVENHKLYFREVAQLSTLSTKLSTSKIFNKNQNLILTMYLYYGTIKEQ